MTDAHLKVKMLLLESGDKTFADLAKKSRLSKQTIRNALKDTQTSNNAKQAITNAFAEMCPSQSNLQIWPGVLPTNHAFILRPGDEISVTDEASAQRWLEIFRNRLERRGDVLVVTKRMALVIHEPESDDAETRGLELLSSDEGDRKYGSAMAGAKQSR